MCDAKHSFICMSISQPVDQFFKSNWKVGLILCGFSNAQSFKQVSLYVFLVLGLNCAVQLMDEMA